MTHPPTILETSLTPQLKSTLGKGAPAMADEDEELSHLRALDSADVDLSDETQDFRFLDKLTYGELLLCFVA